MSDVVYTITQVNEVTLLDAAKNPVAGYRLYFTWGGGRTSSVDIPRSEVNGLPPEQVAEVKERHVQAEISRMDALW